MPMHLDTIPLWDSFREGSDCPLCALRQRIEAQFLDGTLGGAAMEPDIRQMSNAMGYCAPHFKALLDRRQALPLALITHTHLVETREKLEPAMDSFLNPPEKKKGLFPQKGQPDPVEDLLTVLKERADSCMICARTQRNMTRYLETCADLYRKDKAFAALFAEGKGFCLPHFSALTRVGKEKLSGEARKNFLTDLLTQQRQALAGLDASLKAFTLSFDYRNAGAGQDASVREALPRTIEKLRGKRKGEPL